MAVEMSAQRAYVTLMAGDGDSWKAVVGLAKRLQEVGSAYPLVVAVLPDVPESHRRILVSQGCIIREVEPVCPPENQTKFAMAYCVINYSKLRIWEFVEYERMVYLDANVQVLENIDELFELDKGHLYAVMDCFCDRTWSHTPQYKIGYCQQCPDKVAWPATAELGPPPPKYFNAGVFVHEPSMATAKALLDTLRLMTPSTPLAEQDLLNMFFREEYKPIPLMYNLVPAMLWRHPENVQVEKVKVLHCAAGKEAKNMDREDLKKMLVKNKWRNIYNDETLDLKGLPTALPAAATEKKAPPFSNWLATAKEFVFARENLPAVATLASSSAAAGVVASAANPAICFSFYTAFIAAIVVVIISLRRM